MINEAIINDGDLVELVGKSHFHHIFKIKHGDQIQSHKGVINTDDLIGKPWGSIVESHNGNQFYALQPALTDLIKNLPRNTQILYPRCWSGETCCRSRNRVWCAYDCAGLCRW